MSKLFSAKKFGFYDSNIHSNNIPDDAVEITDDEYWLLLNGQANGVSITADQDGKPRLTPAVFNFEAAIQVKLNDINNKRDQALKRQDATVEANGSTWQVDPNAMAELNDAITLSTALGAAPEGLEWRDSDNVNHPATLPLLLAIASARAVQKDAIWKHSWQLKAQLEALDSETATQADIDNIVVEFD